MTVANAVTAAVVVVVVGVFVVGIPALGFVFSVDCAVVVVSSCVSPFSMVFSPVHYVLWQFINLLRSLHVV